MDAALALFPLGIIAAVYVWQSGRTERQRMAIGWQREKVITEQHAAQKRWEDEKAETLSKYEALRAEVSALTTDLKRHLEGREVIPRKAS